MREAMDAVDKSGEIVAQPILNVMIGLANDRPFQIGSGFFQQGLMAAARGLLRNARQDTENGRGRPSGNRGETKWTREEIAQTRSGERLYQ